MNKKIIVIALFLLVVLTACTPEPQGIQTSTAVQLNPTLFDGLLIALFTYGTIYIFEKLNLDLRQYAVPIALTVSTFLVGAIQGWVNVQPIELDPWILLGERVLAALLAGFGALRMFSQKPKTLLPSN